MSAPIKVVALAGGIGGARFLKGLRLIDNLEISVVINNGDDIDMHGPVSYTHLTLPTNREV